MQEEIFCAEENCLEGKHSILISILLFTVFEVLLLKCWFFAESYTGKEGTCTCLRDQMSYCSIISEWFICADFEY